MVELAPIGAPGSTTASPKVPYQAPHAAMTAACSSGVSGMPPPWKARRYFGMTQLLSVSVSDVPSILGEAAESGLFRQATPHRRLALGGDRSKFPGRPTALVSPYDPSRGSSGVKNEQQPHF